MYKKKYKNRSWMLNICMAYYRSLDSLFPDLLALFHHLSGWWKGENKNLHGLGSIARSLKLCLLSCESIWDLGYQTWSNRLYWNANGVKVGLGECYFKIIRPLVVFKKSKNTRKKLGSCWICVIYQSLVLAIVSFLALICA